MNTYKRSEKNSSLNDDLMGQKRQQKALREFKEVLQNLVLMLRKASGMETVYLYWINRDRRQFVMETKSTELSEIVFQDRISFDEHFLKEYKDIREPLILEVGKDINANRITHYYGETPVKHIALLPFVNNEETVAITVVESAVGPMPIEQNEVIGSYVNALGNVLNTYLEISDLYEYQNEWVDYEENLDFLNYKGHYTGMITQMLDTMQSFLSSGGVSFIGRGMGTWNNVLNSSEAEQPIPLGMPVEQRSVAKDALESGQPEFAIHFNRNPKRISPREPYTEGATLAIPMIFNDYRKGIVLVYEKNPLVFKESTKHKLINIVRLAGLKIQAKLKNRTPDESLLTNKYGAFIPDMWERVIDMQIDRLQNSYSVFHTWAGMVTLSGLSEIRTQLRLEELDYMQKDLVRTINPSRHGVPGFVGFHSDYIYMVLLQSTDPQAIHHWVDELQREFSTPFELLNGKTIQTEVDIGFNKLSAQSGESYEVISNVKRSLSEQVKAN